MSAPRETDPATPAPGPRGLAAVRSLERLRVDLLDELDRLHAAHGDTVLVAAPGYRMLVTYDPRDVEHVFVKAATSVRKGYAFRRSRRLLGNGLITSDGAFHLRQRRMMAPCLQPRHLTPYADVMVEETDRTIAQWHEHGTSTPIDVERSMGRLGLAVIGRTMFDRDLSADATGVYRAIETARSQFVGSLALFAPLAMLLPLPRTIAFRRARRTLRRVVEAAIAARAGDDAAASERPDLLSLLLDARDADGQPMSRRQLVDEALTSLLAGHDTIANTLTWTLHVLATRPHLQEQLAAEVLEACCSDRAPTIDDIEQLPLTRAVFLETLRLYPQCYSMTRTALEPIDLPSGTRIERGWEILVPQWSIHRDERWWPYPDQFDPARFVDEPGCPRSAPASASDLPRLAYFPFGAGRRVCIGQAYSMMEGVLVLARLMQRVRFSPVGAASEASLNAMFTLWPGPVHLRVDPAPAAPVEPAGVAPA